MNSQAQAEQYQDEKELKLQLPLKGDKPSYFKIGAVIILIVIVIISNYFFFNGANKVKETIKDQETYEANIHNPITRQNDSGTVKTPMGEDSQAILQQRIAEAKAKDFIDRLQVSQNASVEGGGGQYSGPTVQPNVSAGGSPAVVEASHTSDDPNTAFLLRTSNSKAERELATHFGPLPYVIGQGKFIFGTLDMAINSDLPGQIRATVSQDVYGEQGRKVLIPRGSRLIGEYRSGLMNNQSRLFTVWTRVLEPNGVDIQLGSEGTDSLGRAGLTGNVDYHFFDRFGSALLISLIGAGAANVGVGPSDQYNSAASYRQSVSQAMAEQAKNTLNQNINIPPTINVAQGEKVVVFVNRDLDFSRVYR